MSFGNRLDLPSKPQDRLTRPHVSYPATNTETFIMVEDVALDGDFVPLILGQTRQDWSDLKLVSQKQIESTGGLAFMRRVWSTDWNAQDAQELSTKYTSEAHAYPIYIRRYILPFPVTPLTEGTPLTAVIGIAVATPGTGYTTTPLLSFSGGGGTGATAKCQIRDAGANTAVQMTAGGTGYTTAPTVVQTGGDGTGLTFTASIQPQSALLISQEQKPAEGELGSLYAEVTRVWMTMPQLTDADAKTFGYKIEFPYGSVDFPRVTWKMPTTSQATDTPLSGTCPIAGYTGLLLIGQTYEKENGVVVSVTRIYENNPGPSIVESEYEPRTGRPVLVTKQIVATSTVPATAALLDDEINGYTAVTMTSITAGIGTTTSPHGLSLKQEFYFTGMSSMVAITGGLPAGSGSYYVASIQTSTTFGIAQYPNGSVLTGASATGGVLHKRNLARGIIIEYKPMGMDKMRCIKVTSQIALDNLDWLWNFPDRITYGQHPFSFPDELISANWLWAEAWDGSGKWHFDIALNKKIQQGYRGPCLARITERYISNPMHTGFALNIYGSYPVTQFFPEAVSIASAYWYANSTYAVASARTFEIGPTLHGTITIGNADDVAPNAGNAGDGNVKTISATTPTTYPAGYITADIQKEKDRFGIWKYTIIEIIHP